MTGDGDKRLREFARKAEARPHTLDEIAVVLGVTRERVRQIEMMAKRKFRERLKRLLKAEGIDGSEILKTFNNYEDTYYEPEEN